MSLQNHHLTFSHDWGLSSLANENEFSEIGEVFVQNLLGFTSLDLINTFLHHIHSLFFMRLLFLLSVSLHENWCTILKLFQRHNQSLRIIYHIFKILLRLVPKINFAGLLSLLQSLLVHLINLPLQLTQNILYRVDFMLLMLGKFAVHAKTLKLGDTILTHTNLIQLVTLMISSSWAEGWLKLRILALVLKHSFWSNWIFICLESGSKEKKWTFKIIYLKKINLANFFINRNRKIKSSILSTSFFLFKEKVMAFVYIFQLKLNSFKENFFSINQRDIILKIK